MATWVCFVLMVTVYQKIAGITVHSNITTSRRTFQTLSGCPNPEDVISVGDVQDACLSSKYAYHDVVKVGDFIPGTMFNVTFIYEDALSKPLEESKFRVLIAQRGLTTIVAFRGTDSTKQLLTQAIGMIRKFKGIDDVTAGTHTKINAYFLVGFNLLFPAIRHQLVDQSRRYIITGHSLGGAMASILAIKMTQYDYGKMWENPRTCLVTFGEPRVGNSAFARLHDRLISTYSKLRFVAEKDPIPHIPLWPTFLHHSREVLLDYERGWFFREGDKYWRICNKEQISCSNFYTLTPRLLDHNMPKYEKYIMNPPQMFKDRLKSNKNSFQRAMLSSCHATESETTFEDGAIKLIKRMLVAMDKEI